MSRSFRTECTIGDTGGGDSKDGMSNDMAIPQWLKRIGAMRTLPLGKRPGYEVKASTAARQNQP
jgi:hypothetical protein